MPLESSLQQLHGSPAYRRVGSLLRSGLRETWDAGDVRMLCYTAEYEGKAATAVFAVPRWHYRPEEIRVALVDESTESTLLVTQGARPGPGLGGRRGPDLQDSSATIRRARARSSG